MPSRILFVTGKGGSGKSSVASALAREASARGPGSLLIRMPPAGLEAAGAAKAARRPSPRAELVLDPARDLEAFLTRIVGFGLVARRLSDSRTFSAVAAAAPGLGDFVSLAAILEAASRTRGLVVVDAPASGHSVPLLASAARVLDLAPIGPVAREARRALAVLADPSAFTVVIVTTPEELSLTEAVALRGEVADAGVASSRVVVNARWPARISPEDAELLLASGASPDASAHWQRRRRQDELLARFDARLGGHSSIHFRFGDEELDRGEVAAVLDTIGSTASGASR